MYPPIFSYPVFCIYFIKNSTHYMQYIETICVHTCTHSTIHSVCVCVCTFTANTALEVMQNYANTKPLFDIK